MVKDITGANALATRRHRHYRYYVLEDLTMYTRVMVYPENLKVSSKDKDEGASGKWGLGIRALVRVGTGLGRIEEVVPALNMRVVRCQCLRFLSGLVAIIYIR